MTALLGWESIPWAYLFVLIVVATAMAALGLNHWAQWRSMTSPADKLAAGDLVVAIKEGDNHNFEGLGLGISILNSANFPIELQITDFVTQLDNRVPQKEFEAHSVVIPPKPGTVFTRRSPIILNDINLNNKILLGKLVVTGQYGKVGNPKYQFVRDIHVLVRFDQNGKFEMAEQSLLPLTVD